MKKLNLGCGGDYREGWVNVDIRDKGIYGNKIKIDVKHDLNKYPYPFRNNEFDEIIMIGVLEHIKNFNKCSRELSRISKKECLIKIRVPYFLSYLSARELYTHRFSLNNIQLFNLFSEKGLKLISKRFYNQNKFLRWIANLINISEATQNIYERFFTGIFIVSSINWKFKKIK